MQRFIEAVASTSGDGGLAEANWGGTACFVGTPCSCLTGQEPEKWNTTGEPGQTARPEIIIWKGQDERLGLYLSQLECLSLVPQILACTVT